MSAEGCMSQAFLIRLSHYQVFEFDIISNSGTSGVFVLDIWIRASLWLISGKKKKVKKEKIFYQKLYLDAKVYENIIEYYHIYVISNNILKK